MTAAPPADPVPVPPSEPVPATCGDAFKNASDCYSAGYQMTTVYRYGVFDSCDGRWEAIWACMDRSKRAGGLTMNSPVPLSKKEGDEPEKGKPFWTLMDPKDAEKRWRATFGSKVPTKEELEDEARR